MIINSNDDNNNNSYYSFSGDVPHTTHYQIWFSPKLFLIVAIIHWLFTHLFVHKRTSLL